MMTEIQRAGNSANQLARDLSQLLEDVVFNIEHGIPWKVVHELERMTIDLDRLQPDDPMLRQEIVAFRAGVNELFATSEAAEEVIVHGERIVARLRGEEGRDAPSEGPAHRG